MSLKKDDAINNILSDFEEFANLVLTQLDLLKKQLHSEELAIPEELMETFAHNEKKLDRFEVKISDKIVNTIVLHNPMASDLRKIISCYRISLNLERIGDQIMNVIYFINSLDSNALFRSVSDSILNMLEISIDMVRKSLLSFINNDKDMALWTIKNDEVIDEINKKALKKSLAKNEVSEIEQKMILNYINIKDIIGNMERIADHATNIAEAAIYSMEGRDIRHQSKPLE